MEMLEQIMAQLDGGADMLGGEVPAETKEKAQRTVKQLKTELDAAQKKRRWVVDMHRRNRALVCGPRHGESDSAAVFEKDKRPGSSPINIMARMVTAYRSRLCPLQWDIRCTPKLDDARSESLIRTYLMQYFVQQTKMPMMHRMVVSDALYCSVGVMWVGPIAGTAMELASTKHLEPGDVASMRIDPADYACDSQATSPDEVMWESVRYHVPIAKLRAAGTVSPEILEKLVEKDRGDDLEQSETKQGDEGSDIEYVELRDWFFYDDDVTMTCTTSEGVDDFVRPMREYEGPDEGPLHVLVFNQEPGLCVGRSPTDIIADISVSSDMVYVKANDSALASKTVLTHDPDTVGVADLVAKAKHLAVLGVPAGSSVEVMQLDLIAPNLLQFLEYAQNEANKSTADVQGSMGAKGIANTAREATLMANNAARQYADLESQIGVFTTAVLRCMGHWVDKLMERAADPMAQEMEAIATVPGGQSIPVAVPAPQYGRDDFDYSLMLTTTAITDPVQRAEVFMGSIERLLPVMQMFASNPIASKVIADEIASLTGMPKLAMIFGSPEQFAALQQAEQMAGSKVTLRPKQSQPAAAAGGSGGLAAQPTAQPMASGAVSLGGQTPVLPSNPVTGLQGAR